MPLVSVIVPVYNVENVLERCIESILKQTFINFELILVDDGSTDESGNICDEFALQDKRIHVIHKVNEGVSIARNIGINTSKGKYILFCDSDDFVEVNWIKNMLQQINENKDNYIFCGIKIRNQDNINFFEDQLVEFKNQYELNDFITLHLNSKTGFVWNVLYYSKILKENNIYFDTKMISDDLPFNLLYLKYMKNLVFTNSYDYNYVQYSNNTLSRKYYKDSYRKWKEKYCITIDFIKNNIDDERMKTLITNVSTYYLYLFLRCLKNTFDKRNNDGILKKLIYNNNIVNDQIFQECLYIADATNENPQYINLLKRKKYLHAELLTFLSKIKRLIIKGDNV